MGGVKQSTCVLCVRIRKVWPAGQTGVARTDMSEANAVSVTESSHILIRPQSLHLKALCF